jgi:hypothetical protein
MDDSQIEANKLKAVKGWISDPPPETKEPLPAAHMDKWRKMNLKKKA